MPLRTRLPSPIPLRSQSTPAVSSSERSGPIHHRLTPLHILEGISAHDLDVIESHLTVDGWRHRFGANRHLQPRVAHSFLDQDLRERLEALEASEARGPDGNASANAAEEGNTIPSIGSRFWDKQVQEFPGVKVMVNNNLHVDRDKWSLHATKGVSRLPTAPKLTDDDSCYSGVAPEEIRPGVGARWRSRRGWTCGMIKALVRVWVGRVRHHVVRQMWRASARA